MRARILICGMKVLASDNVNDAAFSASRVCLFFGFPSHLHYLPFLL
jgi:hypothetical protein